MTALPSLNHIGFLFGKRAHVAQRDSKIRGGAGVRAHRIRSVGAGEGHAAAPIASAGSAGSGGYFFSLYSLNNKV